jgi:uncharacterized protein (TIGR02118 family)
MIKVSVVYPNKAGSRFDIEYYCSSHMPMVADRLGAALIKTEVDQGIGGGMPGSPAAFAAMGHLYFDSVAAFQGAIMPHFAEIMEDVANYTDIEPVIQISEIRG